MVRCPGWSRCRQLVISIVTGIPSQPQAIDGLRLAAFHSGVVRAGTRLTPTCDGLAAILLTTRIGGFQPLAHLLKGGSVDLSAGVTLLQYLHRRRTACRRSRCTCFSIEPAQRCPGKHYQQGDPENSAQRHEKHAPPAETISPHHISILTFIIYPAGLLPTGHQEGDTQTPFRPEVSLAPITFLSHRLPTVSQSAHGMISTGTVVIPSSRRRLSPDYRQSVLPFRDAGVVKTVVP